MLLKVILILMLLIILVIWIRVLSTNIDTNTKKKYCRFKRSGIKYIDYKDPDFLIKFVNEQGKILPRRLTGTSLKYQRKVVSSVSQTLDGFLQFGYVGNIPHEFVQAFDRFVISTQFLCLRSPVLSLHPQGFQCVCQVEVEGCICWTERRVCSCRPC